MMETQLVPFVKLTKSEWTPVHAFEGGPILPVILGSNMKDLIGTCALGETQEGIYRVSLLLHEGLEGGPWYALPVGSLGSVERENKKIVSILTYRLAAIQLSQDAPEGSEHV